jgi:hypothetical protein
MFSTPTCIVLSLSLSLTDILRTLRYLVKSPLPFDSIKKEKNFYSNLLILCRDGSNPDANKQAWKMVYELVKHHGGVVAFLDSTKLLNQLLETVSISAPLPVIRNSLFYIAQVRTCELALHQAANCMIGVAVVVGAGVIGACSY